jgi:hypothetical protein
LTRGTRFFLKGFEMHKYFNFIWFFVVFSFFMESCRTVRQGSSSLSSMVNGEEEGGGSEGGGGGKKDTPDSNEGNEKTTPKKGEPFFALFKSLEEVTQSSVQFYMALQSILAEFPTVAEENKTLFLKEMEEKYKILSAREFVLSKKLAILSNKNIPEQASNVCKLLNELVDDSNVEWKEALLWVHKKMKLNLIKNDKTLSGFSTEHLLIQPTQRLPRLKLQLEGIKSQLSKGGIGTEDEPIKICEKTSLNLKEYLIEINRYLQAIIPTEEELMMELLQNCPCSGECSKGSISYLSAKENWCYVDYGKGLCTEDYSKTDGRFAQKVETLLENQGTFKYWKSPTDYLVKSARTGWWRKCEP